MLNQFLYRTNCLALVKLIILDFKKHPSLIDTVVNPLIFQFGSLFKQKSIAYLNEIWHTIYQ